MSENGFWFALPRFTPTQPVQCAPAAPVDMDEDTQLQLALNLSKEEHQQVGLHEVVESLPCNAVDTLQEFRNT